MRLIIIATAACFLGGVLFFLFRPEHSQEPDLSPLADSVKQRMNAILNAPNLSESTLAISVVKSQLTAEVDRVKYLAAKLGGSAAAKQPGVGPITEIIAEIPEENQKRFIDAVEDGFKDVPDSQISSSGRMSVVTIQINTQS